MVKKIDNVMETGTTEVAANMLGNEIGVEASATALSGKIEVGPIPFNGNKSSLSIPIVSYDVGQVSAGAKLKASAKNGLEAKFEATATLTRLEVGPASASLGIGVDTGVKIDASGADVKFMGTGFEFGQKGLEASFFGSKVGLNPEKSAGLKKAFENAVPGLKIQLTGEDKGKMELIWGSSEKSDDSNGSKNNGRGKKPSFLPFTGPYHYAR